MLEDHERAARMPNDGNVTWHQFVRSRFVGQPSSKPGSPSLTIDVQTVRQESTSHAELHGLLEYSAASSLPVVFEFLGTLMLETREVLIDDAQGDKAERSYTGSLSENGRVLTLRPRGSDKSHAKPIHLIHEGTMTELFGD
jgi:hypothetical protein